MSMVTMSSYGYFWAVRVVCVLCSLVTIKGFKNLKLLVAFKNMYDYLRAFMAIYQKQLYKSSVFCHLF